MRREGLSNVWTNDRHFEEAAFKAAVHVKCANFALA